MNAKQFREFGYAAIDFVADYMENVHERFIIIEVSKCFENLNEKNCVNQIIKIRVQN